MRFYTNVNSNYYILLWLIYIFISALTIFLVSRRPIKSSVSSSDASFLCDINSSTQVSSTRRDVVLLFATNFAPGLELCIKSLRSTGSECRIVLFCAPGFVFSRYLQRLLQAMKVEVVPDCVETHRRSYVPHMLRFEYELDWLKKHRKGRKQSKSYSNNTQDTNIYSIEDDDSLDRVLHTDSFDVFFQGDPFEYIPHDSLTFVVEPHQFRSCGWNLGWLTECYEGAVVSRMTHNFIICSGSIAGSIDHYIKLLELMIQQSAWSRCYKPSMDQPILNYLVWNGHVANEGIKYRLTGCDDGFLTVQWCVLENKPLYNSHGQIISQMKSVPSYIHQYNRLPPMMSRLYRQCHIPY